MPIMSEHSQSSQRRYETGAFNDSGIEVLDLRRESRRGLFTEGVRLLRDIFLIVAAFVLLFVFVMQPVVVEGSSMDPQLKDGERLLVNKLIYYKIDSVSWGHLERGDVVVFWYPNNPDKSFVKRVIGLPGETVELRGGKVLVNGVQLKEPYVEESHNRLLADNEVVPVAPYHYFVMGDNRDNSSDSRAWGLVPEKYIYGKVFMRYWPPSTISGIEHASYDLPESVDATRPPRPGSLETSPAR